MISPKKQKKIKNFYRATKSLTATISAFKISKKNILKIIKGKYSCQCDSCFKQVFYDRIFWDKLKFGRYCLQCMDAGKHLSTL